jgi:hypothetical protein
MNAGGSQTTLYVGVCVWYMYRPSFGGLFFQREELRAVSF